jgi:hypothetical protein
MLEDIKTYVLILCSVRTLDIDQGRVVLHDAGLDEIVELER